MSDCLSKRKCSLCGGTGREYNRKLINEMIDDLDLEMKDVASALGVSKSYFSRLMSGKRRWTPELVEKLQALGAKA